MKLKQAKQTLDDTDVDNLENPSSINIEGKKKRNEKIKPKLFVSGRLNRKKHKYISRSLILLKNVEDDVKDYCRGGDLCILNYLIKEGLKSIKSKEEALNIDMEDIEQEVISHDIT